MSHQAMQHAEDFRAGHALGLDHRKLGMWLFIAGLMGMPRRVAAYDASFTSYNQWATLGALILAASTLPFLYNTIVSWARGPKAAANPWQAQTLEWRTSSPPPLENFSEIPIVTGGPYDYGEPSAPAAEPAAAPAAG